MSRGTFAHAGPGDAPTALARQRRNQAPHGRPVSYEDAEDHDGHCGEYEWPHGLGPARGRGDDDRQDDGSQNESVDEPMPREGEPGDPTRRLA
jgi:hypothetical protein